MRSSWRTGSRLHSDAGNSTVIGFDLDNEPSGYGISLKANFQLVVPVLKAALRPFGWFGPPDEHA
jgi:hypothetical protein